MDSSRFDTMTRALTAAPSRRTVLHLGLGGGLAALLGRGEAGAKKKGKGKKKKKKGGGGPTSCGPTTNCGADGAGACFCGNQGRCASGGNRSAAASCAACPAGTADCISDVFAGSICSPRCGA